MRELPLMDQQEIWEVLQIKEIVYETICCFGNNGHSARRVSRCWDDHAGFSTLRGSCIPKSYFRHANRSTCSGSVCGSCGDLQEQSSRLSTLRENKLFAI